MLEHRIKHWKHSAWIYLFSTRIKRLSDKICVAFTFDTEKDWVNTKPTFYYNSYKYITSGVFYRLVDGLAEMDISATYYVTCDIARDMPEVLKYLEESNQKIGVHIHPHDLMDVEYPYNPGKDSDSITFYNLMEKLNWMKLVKDQIESIVSNKVLLYRSGNLACDNETIKAAKLTGFKAISNHRGIYYIKPLGIWNVGAGTEDLFDFNTFNELSKYIMHHKERTEGEQIIVFSAHPMLLYDHATNEIKEKELPKPY